jgi:hypothetical protein
MNMDGVIALGVFGGAALLARVVADAGIHLWRTGCNRRARV